MNLIAVRAKSDHCRISNNRADLVGPTRDDEVLVKGAALSTVGTGDFVNVEIVDGSPLGVGPME
jgi:hypothetical protein